MSLLGRGLFLIFLIHQTDLDHICPTLTIPYLLVKRLIGDAKKAFLVIKKGTKNKIIPPLPFDEFERNHEINKIAETEGEGGREEQRA